MKTTVLAILMMLCCMGCLAQTDSTRYEPVGSDSIFVISSDSALLQDLAPLDTIVEQEVKQLEMRLPLPDSTLTPKKKQKRDWATWVPSPQRALWLALVIPGGGQIYNRKYWKLPIVYGGFMGCIYALTWNNTMYKDYSQAFIDISDDDPATASYMKFMHLGRVINDQNLERYKTLFKKRKDKYRRWRDLSFFVMVGIYAVSVIDAYVDAELSVFDISKDLSLKVQPTVIGNPLADNPIYASSLGVNCSLNF
ncbi:MAG: hypothetical protein II864_12180 [Prevotella sp.]|jgi:hypothetical protein|nr:hypothetical protein [Prevotella sp.]